MSKRAKIFFGMAIAFILIGGIIFGGVMTVLGWDFTKLSTVKYETNDYEIKKDYKNISITTDTADVIFVPTESEQSSVVCYEQKNVKHSVTVIGDTLVIEAVDTRKWYEYIGIFFGTPKITVYIPQGEYGALSVKGSTGDVEIPEEHFFESMDLSVSTGDVKCGASSVGKIRINTNTGDIYVKNISAGMLDLSVSTGKVVGKAVTCEDDLRINVSTGKAQLTGVSCKALISSGNTGDISLKNVIAAEMFSVVRSTGDIKLDSCDAAEIYFKTDTGNVTGSLLTEKVFITQTDTGKIDVPKTVTGGKCEIITSTGDVTISIQ